VKVIAFSGQSLKKDFIRLSWFDSALENVRYLISVDGISDNTARASRDLDD